MCVVIACVKRRGFCHTHAKAEKSKSDITEKVKVNNRLIFSLQFSSVSFMRCNNKNISKKYLSNALTHLTENEKIHFWTFTFYSKKKYVRLNTPLISPFSCNVFKEGLREMNFFNLLFTRLLSFVSEAL